MTGVYVLLGGIALFAVTIRCSTSSADVSTANGHIDPDLTRGKPYPATPRPTIHDPRLTASQARAASAPRPSSGRQRRAALWSRRGA